MGALSDRPGKRGAFTHGSKTCLSRNYGSNSLYPVTRGKISEQAAAKMLSAAETKRAQVTAQILDFYSPGWKGLNPKERLSLNSISQALLRRGIVTALKDQTTVAHVLQSLVRARKIRLPPKSNNGG